MPGTITAKNITSDITWIMEDNRLERAANFKVKTTRRGGEFVTVIEDVTTELALVALGGYLDYTPGHRTTAQGRTFTVYQPAGA